MKRIGLFLAIVLLIPLNSYASSVGGAETQGKGKFAIGIEDDYIAKRKMEFQKATFGLAADESITDVEISNLNRTMVKASYGIIDNIDVYAEIGAASLRFKDADVVAGTPDDDYYGKYKGHSALAYGFGIKADYFLGENKDWIVGIDASMIIHTNRYSATGSSVSGGTETWKGKMPVKEWQVAPYIAKKIGKFTPYTGVKYSDLRSRITDMQGDKIHYKAKNNIGTFVGTEYSINKNLALNVEGRFVDETAVSVGASYKF